MDDRPQDARTVDEPMISIVGIAIRISERYELFLSAVKVDAIDLIFLLITDVKEAGLIPNRTLGEPKVCGHARQLSFLVDEFPKFWRLGPKFKTAAGGFRARHSQRTVNSDRRCNDANNPSGSSHSVSFLDGSFARIGLNFGLSACVPRPARRSYISDDVI